AHTPLVAFRLIQLPLKPTGVVPEDVCSRTCCGGDVAESGAGRRSTGSGDSLKAASRRQRLSLFSTSFTSSLQSGEKVCASGLKQVIVAMPVPSSMMIQKQYL
nr:hypothetical protein [Tanacetum cinerariifolium]